MADYLSLAIPNATLYDVTGKLTGSIYTEDSTQEYPIGVRYREGPCTYRYCRAGAVIGHAARGKINGHIVPGDTGTSGYEGAAGYLSYSGETEIEVSDTEATHTKNYYSGGTLVIFRASPAGYHSHFILGSTASDGTSLVLTLATAIYGNLTAAGIGIQIRASAYSKIMNGSGVQARYESFVVVPACNITTSGYFFWGQTLGPCWVTPHGINWPGSGVVERDCYFYQDGTIDPASTATVGTLAPQRAGYLLDAISTATYGDAIIQLMIE